MATQTECDYYHQCGFVAWRKDRPNFAKPLPENGCCGIDINYCGRINNNNGHLLSNGQKIPIDFYGPKFDNEAKFINF